MTSPTLLYIDDTLADTELLRTLLELRGVQVVSAYRADKGIKTYDPTYHHAVVIDWNLPDMEGLEAARILLKYHPQCPIAFLSGVLNEEHIAAAHALGIERCFEKNVSLDHIDHIGTFVHECARQVG